ncbi:MAG: hypothetical protein ACK50P_13435, partial [Planctomycetaceae bacterium]
MSPLPLAADFLADQGLALIGSLLVGGALTILAWLIQRALSSEDLEQDLEWRYDVNRINELRRSEPLYRIFFPLVQLLARFNRGLFADSLPEIQREIQAAGLSRFWTAPEYLGKLQLIAVLLFPILMYSCIEMMGPPGAIMAVALTILLAWILRVRLAARARRRLVLIKRRMP